MRLRTLPVSCAGVVMGWGCALRGGCFKAVPASLCLVFAILAQVASNFANEYYDYRAGLDRAGRDGPRRGVTEGDITPRAMRRATYMTLALAAAVGLCLIPYGGWWLIAAGAVIAAGALAYSAGPYPLSHHRLGEVAVILFFGLVPVCLTCYVQSGQWDNGVIPGGFAIGLMGANVLLVNNYRDYDDDRAVGKHTLTGLIGRRATVLLYMLNGYAAAILTVSAWHTGDAASAHLERSLMTITLAYTALHTVLTIRLARTKGPALTRILGMTAMLMSATALAAVIAIACQA